MKGLITLEPELDDDFSGTPGGSGAAFLPAVPRQFCRRRTPNQNQSRTWSATHVRLMNHSHDWTVNCFSQCDQRYLETTVSVSDAPDMRSEDLGGDSKPSLMFRVRLHPQGNKESNKDFCFFQVFPITHVNKYNAKFYVYNSKGDEISTTVYAGTQQLNGYFEYVRRDLLLSHVAPEDEVHLTVRLTIFADPVTRCGLYRSDELKKIVPDDVGKDLEKEFDDPRFSDFKIHCRSGKSTKTLHVHKVILSGRSSFFNAMLAPHTNEFKNDEVTFEDIDYEALAELVHFLYTGRAPKLDLMAMDLLSLADRFQVNSLKEAAEKSLRKNMNVESICTTLIMADLHNARDLKEDALNYIAEHSIDVVKTEGWQLMLADHSKLLTDVVVKMNDVTKVEPMAKRLRQY